MKTLEVKKIIVAIGLLFVNTSYAYTTFGVRDCGQWLSGKTDGRKAWVVGFMSGLNVMHSLNNNKDDPLGKINSVEQIYAWMDNYCQKNPLKETDEGGVTLLLELMGKSSK